VLGELRELIRRQLAPPALPPAGNLTDGQIQHTSWSLSSSTNGSVSTLRTIPTTAARAADENHVGPGTPEAHNRAHHEEVHGEH